MFIFRIETVYADETQTTTKTFTADQLTKAFAGGADGTSCELGKEGWNVALKHDAEQEYPQAVWNLSESFDLANVESVAFNVESQEGDIALKLGMTNASGWYEDVEACYGQNGQKQYTIVPGPGKYLGCFCRDSEFFIPWAKVIRIGPDIILVEFDEKEMKHRIKG